MKTLKDFLHDWVDPEIAKYYLGCVLGILELHKEDTEPWCKYMQKTKGVYAGGTEEHDLLHDLLQRLVRDGVLEKADRCKYRWNANYKGFWERIK